MLRTPAHELLQLVRRRISNCQISDCSVFSDTSFEANYSCRPLNRCYYSKWQREQCTVSLDVAMQTSSWQWVCGKPPHDAINALSNRCAMQCQSQKGLNLNRITARHGMPSPSDISYLPFSRWVHPSPRRKGAQYVLVQGLAQTAAENLGRATEHGAGRSLICHCFRIHYGAPHASQRVKEVPMSSGAAVGKS